MAFGGFDNSRRSGPMADINVVPLVDVMLVLLVIFIITAPLLTNAVKIDLPKASSNVNLTQPDHVEFGIREDGAMFWNGEQAVSMGLADRLGSLDQIARDEVKAEDIIDYTQKENLAERLAKRFGAAVGAGAVQAMREATLASVRSAELTGFAAGKLEQTMAQFKVARA